MKMRNVMMPLMLAVIVLCGCAAKDNPKQEKLTAPKTSTIADKEASIQEEPALLEEFLAYDHVRIETVAVVRFYLDQSPEGNVVVIGTQGLNDYGTKVLAAMDPTGLLYDEAITVFVENALAQGYISDINKTIRIEAKSDEAAILEQQAAEAAGAVCKMHGIEAVVDMGGDDEK